MSDDRVQALVEQLHQKVAALASGTDWQAMLIMAAKFHQYSANNLILIWLQCPEATQVAGYGRWRELGRQVKKGAKGIQILAPLTYKRQFRDEDSGEEKTGTGIRGYRIVHVFDISQTDGEAIPEAPRPTLLEGEAPEGLRVQLVQAIQAQGYVLRFPGPPNWSSSANGYTDFQAKVVAIRPELSDAQQAKTLAHELGHVLLHDGTEYSAGHRGISEVEAESFAFVICQAAGMVTDDYSLPYVAGWSNGDMKLVLSTANRVTKAAGKALSGLMADANRSAA